MSAEGVFPDGLAARLAGEVARERDALEDMLTDLELDNEDLRARQPKRDPVTGRYTK